MDNSTINLIVGVIVGGGVIGAIVYFLEGNKIADVTKIFNLSRNSSKEINIENAEGETVNKDYPDSKNNNESSRRVSKATDAIRKLLGLGLLFLVNTSSFAHLNDEQKMKLNEYLNTTQKYSNAIDKELSNLITNKRKDTEVKVTEVKSNQIFLEITIPVERPLPDYEGQTISSEKEIIKREVKITPIVGYYSHKLGLDFHPVVALGGTISVDSLMKDNLVVAFDTFSFNTLQMRFIAIPFLGTKRFGMGLGFASTEYLSNLRVILGVGKEYAGSNKLSFEVGLATALSM